MGQAGVSLDLGPLNGQYSFTPLPLFLPHQFDDDMIGSLGNAYGPQHWEREVAEDEEEEEEDEEEGLLDLGPAEAPRVLQRRRELEEQALRVLAAARLLDRGGKEQEQQEQQGQQGQEDEDEDEKASAAVSAPATVRVAGAM